MRLEEYSQLLKSDSPTIEFFTKNGKTILCEKKVNEIKEQLEQAKDLLHAMIEAKDVPTIEVIHRLRDLAKVLDHLKLQEECLVVGDCAMKLARAFGSRAVEFQKEEAQTILVIAGLSVYKSRASLLFIQAISIFDGFVILDGSDTAKVTLLNALDRAGAHDEIPPALCAQWLGRAVDLISKVPSPMVTNELRGSVYINYGWALYELEATSEALAAKERAVEFYRSLYAGHGRMMYKNGLALALSNYGSALDGMGRVEAALDVKQEAVSLYRTLAVDGHEKHKKGLADALHNYGNTLHNMGHLKDALSVRPEAVTLYRTLAVDVHEKYKSDLADALHVYGRTLQGMGYLKDALSVQEEAVSLYHTIAVDGHDGHKSNLADALSSYGGTLHNVGHLKDALSVRQEAASLFRTLAIDGDEKHKSSLATALHNYANTLHGMGHLKDALSVGQEAVSLYRTLAIDGHTGHKKGLCDALRNHAITLYDMGHLKHAISIEQEAVSLCRILAVDGHEKHKRNLADTLHNYAITLHDLGHFEDAHSLRQEAESLECTLAIDGREKRNNYPIPPAPSFSSIDVCVTQKDHSTPLSPSDTKSISVTPLSSPSTTQPSPLPTVSPSPSICHDAVMELDPINLHHSSHPPSSCALTDQTPTLPAVIRAGSVSELASEITSGPGRKRKRENGSIWIKNKLRVRK